MKLDVSIDEKELKKSKLEFVKEQNQLNEVRAQNVEMIDNYVQLSLPAQNKKDN